MISKENVFHLSEVNDGKTHGEQEADVEEETKPRQIKLHPIPELRVKRLLSDRSADFYPFVVYQFPLFIFDGINCL